jgi:hypothetical protein
VAVLDSRVRMGILALGFGEVGVLGASMGAVAERVVRDL